MCSGLAGVLLLAVLPVLQSGAACAVAFWEAAAPHQFLAHGTRQLNLLVNGVMLKALQK